MVSGTPPRVFLRCPCCGARRPRTVFVGGALQQHVIEVLTQHFLGCGRGLDGDGHVPVDDDGRPLQGRRRGAFRWTRRPPTTAELELLGRAVATAAERVASRLDGGLPDARPAEVLAAVDDRDFDAVASHLLDEARDELATREALVVAEMERRA